MQLKRILAYTAIYLLWGGSYLAIHFVVQVIPPVFTAAARYSISGLILILFSYFYKRESLPSKRQVGNSFLTGIGMFALGYAGVFWAETRLPSWLVAMLVSTALFWTYCGECLFLRTNRFRLSILLPLLLGLLSMPLLVGATLHQNSMYSHVAIGIVLFFDGKI